jgi:hypothetical protein
MNGPGRSLIDSTELDVCMSGTFASSVPTRRHARGMTCSVSAKPFLQFRKQNTRTLTLLTTQRLYFVEICVLYGCETWSVTRREEHRLTVFENRVLRRIFGPKKDGVTGELRILHNEELNDLYS